MLRGRCGDYQRRLLPHASIYVLEGEGHVLVCGSNEETIERITAAVQRAPLLGT